MQKDVNENGVTDSLIEDFKALRVLVVNENKPLLAKVTRLAYQNIEKNGTFTVGIPEDEPIDEETEVVPLEVDAKESMNYLLSLLLSDLKNKLNTSEIRAYVNLMKEMAGEDY